MILESKNLKYHRPSITEYLDQYNNLLAKILVDNFSLNYLASATINRLEAQTKFYELIEKYIQIRKLLLENNDIRIKLSNEDICIKSILKKEFKERVILDDHNGIIFSIKKKIKILPFLKSLFLTVKYYLLSILYCSLFCRLKKKKKYEYIIRTYFDFRNSLNGKLREEYFGEVADEIGRRFDTLIVFSNLSKKLSNLSLFREIYKTNPYFDAILLESLLTPLSFFLILTRYFFSRIKLKEKTLYKGTDVTAILQTALNEDYVQFRGFNVFVEYYIAKKIIKLCRKRILIPFENQTWEKIYPYIKNLQGKDVSILGYQHTGVSYKLLQYFPAKCEKKLPVYPDIILTVGKTIANLLKDKGCYPCLIKPAFAMRFSKKITDIDVKSKKKVNNSIAYAFSYDVNSYQRIILTLLKVFNDEKTTVLLKFHPDYKVADILTKLNINLPHNFKIASNISWEEIYSNVDFILYNDNSIGIEAISNGVKTFNLDLEEFYHTERFFNFNIWNMNITPDKLSTLKEELVTKTFNKHFPVLESEKYLKEYFYPYDLNKLNLFLM